MPENPTVRAHLVGNPFGGELDNPWPPGRPADGEQVALFLFEVTSVDGTRDHSRTFHTVPAVRAATGALGPATSEPQGVTVRWWGCGTATVAGVPEDDPLSREVRPDDPALLDPAG
ncbi:hypothetical protein H7X46_14250 [Pseudonocardia sp. C8]|uniref:hypothetical protein n=1 Tax=Pseudonocardia sp. C8 TaxID=2762759 RepID=UPI0016429627|nr:hypothetical protein [Pseudonocardia sp. C8]MBC3192223.1 hypothetical protein [Pseudonocardia sp. C8]